MNTNSLTRITSQHWWFMLIWGIFIVLFGLCALFWPYLIPLAPTILFGVFALVNGIFHIVQAIQEHRVYPFWWLVLIMGILSLILGLTVINWLHITSIILLELVAMWAVITGILQIALAISGVIDYSPLLLAIIGVASLLLGIALFVSSPLVPLLPLLRVIGIYGLSYGGVLIVQAFLWRSSQKEDQ